MTLVQRIVTALVPRRWAEAMQAESRGWMLRCPCGFERSIWAAGGIRWKAAGSPRRLVRCPRCGHRTWHTVYRHSG
jgi:DNA-directed RNA polymerase subunit RPC12/RpoP